MKKKKPKEKANCSIFFSFILTKQNNSLVYLATFLIFLIFHGHNNFRFVFIIFVSVTTRKRTTEVTPSPYQRSFFCLKSFTTRIRPYSERKKTKVKNEIMKRVSVIDPFCSLFFLVVVDYDDVGECTCWIIHAPCTPTTRSIHVAVHQRRTFFVHLKFKVWNHKKSCFSLLLWENTFI